MGKESLLGLYFIIPIVWFLFSIFVLEFGFVSDIIFGGLSISTAIFFVGILIAMQINKSKR